MKKVLVVLLVAVMTLTSAFAAVEGSVSASLEYDLDNGTFEYGTDTGLEIEFEFEEVLGADKSGALKPYVVVAAEATIDFNKNFANVTVDEFELTKFQIVGNKWVLDFIPEYAATDLATDVIDGRYVINAKKTAYKFNPYTYTWSINPEKLDLVSFQYDGIGTLTVGADRYHDLAGATKGSVEVLEDFYTQAEIDELDKDAAGTGVSYAKAADKGVVAGYVVDDNNKVVPVYYVVKNTDASALARGADFVIAFESEDIALVDADKLTFKGAAGYSYGWNALNHKNQYDFGASAKVSYMDYATVAADMGFVNADFFDADIAAHIVYAPVTFDAYWAARAAVKSYDGKSSGAEKKDLISLKAVVDVEEINTKFTAIASDIAKKDTNRISFEAVNTSLEKYTFTLGLKDLAHKDDKKGGDGISIYAKVKADFSEDLSANAGFSCGLQKGAPATFSAGVDYTGIENLTLSAKGEVTTGKKDFVDSVNLKGSALYEAALFDAELDVYYNKYTGKNATKYNQADYNKKEPTLVNEAEGGLYLAFDLSSDKIVDGATLDFNWQSGQLSDMAGKKGNFGSLTASCTVEF